MIRRETDYAVRTVLCLARSHVENGSAWISTEDLAAQTEVPYRFLRKIVLKLVKSGIIESRRGKNGGLILGRAPQNISLLDLLQVVEPESVILNQCMEPARTPCSRKDDCGLHHALGKIQISLQRELADISLIDMARGHTATQVVS